MHENCNKPTASTDEFQEGEVGAVQQREHEGADIVFAGAAPSAAARVEDLEDEEDQDQCSAVKLDGLRCKMKVSSSYPKTSYTIQYNMYHVRSSCFPPSAPRTHPPCHQSIRSRTLTS
jgi:hypothetical protein